MQCWFSQGTINERKRRAGAPEINSHYSRLTRGRIDRGTALTLQQ
jgi:hypothetical protein